MMARLFLRVPCIQAAFIDEKFADVVASILMGRDTVKWSISDRTDLDNNPDDFELDRWLIEKTILRPGDSYILERGHWS